MRVLILGADGYLGWPTCMYFSQRGHEVIGVDNYFRRNAAVELDCEPLLPTPNLIQRAKVWEELTGKKINIHIGDATNYTFLLQIFKEYKPEAVIHYAEQPSAPYSMINRDKAAFTLQNNLVSTLNIVYAVKETNPDCHIIKLGTMGEYGTPNIDIEEGWLEIEHKERKDKFLFPRQASSLYHTTKVQDTDMLWFYVRTWGIRVTDLMQGPVYGISTDEADIDSRLVPNFNYDEIFGTVLNRFIVQAIANYPLTVYGKGGQIRGYLNLKDTMQCVYLSATQPAKNGELRIFNQVTETFSVNELADKVYTVGKELGYNIKVDHIENPRKEKEEHYYNPKYTGLLELGLKPNYLTDEVLAGIFRVVERYKDRINREAIFRGIKWK
ncbi:MAG: NAD-dependent epimerase/dehydratase family protein [Candidatus Jettenia sp.]|uniref:NAD-dependent epimerase/dehydratase n=1 Tax=Candidatus Jettenia caeni TaxID=247490 RepID=I3IJY0_9BACT|nr:NAD-dependent epimerase/dehydratase family protein [Candidatus Jettenia sp. AMX1]MBC6927818.1 NAD-dependent epimerase/dehydratase family protein [Candidatus Jettenia sp.]NUN24156.1 NAD-dependent epimerase/dehydratase family protein [Candidatus Jettenia caeni]KAA0250269.1 MAG: NAD-dependent epimerase/dehydratase family protein [Candidatus Jettenia sp. AMX1]MCE7879439.1 NAD-dependent epimerase/dehydratase family protein [Candidatus Jettenia sp. AMX1]MCQ3926139.1 NAD-dependent epimerase/dehydr